LLWGILIISKYSTVTLPIATIGGDFRVACDNLYFFSDATVSNEFFKVVIVVSNVFFHYMTILFRHFVLKSGYSETSFSVRIYVEYMRKIYFTAYYFKIFKLFARVFVLLY
jgi:hypothetical protein